MIVTRKNPVPLRWIIFSIIPWAAVVFKYQVMGTAFVFSLNRFVENPVSLTFIISLPSFLSIALAPLSSFLSDRVWTRFGRRKPFIIVSWIGVISCLFLMPLVPSAWLLIAVFILYNVFNDLGSPIEVINQEIVPPQQRGRATAGMQWCSNFSCLLFYTVVLGRFDEVGYLAGLPVTGEQAGYWSCALLIASMLLIVVLGIKELDPKSRLAGERLSIRTFFGGLLDRELRPVYLLIFASAMLGAGLGPMNALLCTDQWGMSKQDMGTVVGVGVTINLMLIPVMGYFSDRIDRMRTYQVLIVVALAIKAFYWVYVHEVLPDHVPTIVEMIVLGEMLSVTAIMTGVVFSPLVYDYIRRDKMGTYAAGAGMVSRITGLVTLNGVGLFVWAYAALWCPPAGETLRVGMARDMARSEVRQELARVLPDAAGKLSVETWRATRLDLDHGRAFEIRLADPDGEPRNEQRKRLDQERAGLRGDLDAWARDPVARDRYAAAQARIAALDGSIAAIDAETGRRVAAFRARILGALGREIVDDGGQILAAGLHPGATFELPLRHRPGTALLERTVVGLRSGASDVVDIRVIHRDSAYLLGVGIRWRGDRDAAAAAVASELAAALGRVDPTLVAAGASAASVSDAQVLQLDLAVVEEVLDDRISPIMRAAHAIAAPFGVTRPDPGRRIAGLARSLRRDDATPYVRIDPLGDGLPAIRASFVLVPSAAFPPPPDGDAIAARLAELVADRQALPAARSCYDRLVAAGDAQRVTVLRPVIDAARRPVAYDYMAGYIWMFLMGGCGLLATVWFCRLERRGVVAKQGLIEAKEG